MTTDGSEAGHLALSEDGAGLEFLCPCGSVTSVDIPPKGAMFCKDCSNYGFDFDVMNGERPPVVELPADPLPPYLQDSIDMTALERDGFTLTPLEKEER